jgi:antitoxin VapB
MLAILCVNLYVRMTFSMRHTVSEPQLSIRSSKARDLAHALSRRTGQPINRLVELALERYERELSDKPAKMPGDALWDLMAEGRRSVPSGTTSDHDDFYDKIGLPK